MIINHQRIDFGTSPLIEKVTIKPPFRMTLDFPDDACFIFFDSGNARIHAPYEHIKIQQKEAVLLRCGTYFSRLLPTLGKEVYEIVVFHLPIVVLRQIYQDDFPKIVRSNQTDFIHKIDSSQMLQGFIRGLQYYFDHPALMNEDLLKIKIQELILLLMKTRNHSTLKSLFQEAFSPVEIHIKQVVYTHIFTECSTEDLADLCNMSISTFVRQFKKIFNDTPIHFIKSTRLEKARDLLGYSDLTISEIAFQTCFYDPAHFSKTFKKRYGCTPGEYRSAIN